MKLITRLMIYQFVLVFSLMPYLHAQTCAEYLRNHAKWMVGAAIASTLIVPVYGIGGVLMGASIIDRYKSLRAATCLEAATIITNDSPDLKIDKAHRIIDHFYQKLEKLYPEMGMAKTEVIEILHKLNINGKQDGDCHHLGFLAA